MAVSKELVLFGIDGVLLQTKLALDTAEATNTSPTAIHAIMAAVQVLRELVAGQVVGDDLDGCQHPEEACSTLKLGNDHFVKTCTACNEIIEQG